MRDESGAGAPSIPPPHVFANCLKEYLPLLREMAGFSLEQAADWTECPIEFLESYEHGVIPNQDLAANHVLNIAVTFDVPSAMLLGMPPFESMDRIERTFKELRDDPALSVQNTELFDCLPLREKLWVVNHLVAINKKSRTFSDMTTLMEATREKGGTVPSVSWGQPRLMDALGDFERYPDGN